MFNPVRYLFYLIASQLSRFGLIDWHRGQRISSLVWPRFLTMFARDFYRVADIAMVGLAVGPAAIAGLAFASIYWGLVNAFSLGLAGATISQVSQRFGAQMFRQLDLAVKQSIWVGLVITLPFILLYYFHSEFLIRLIGADSTTIALGAAYLQILALALPFNVINQASSRTLAGADDTLIAMSLRATGAILNVILNAFFIFGLNMGVQGAAIGTVIAEGVIAGCFAWGFLSGSLPLVGNFPVKLSLSRPYFDFSLTKQLLTLSPPLIAEHLARSFANFPLFAVLAIFGPTIVASFEIARRIRNLMRATGAGFSMAATGLVGQELGQSNEDEATRFARDVIWFSAIIYAIASIIVIVFARPLARFFAEDPTVINQTIPFIRIAAVSFLALGLTFTFGGILKAAGDNSWILYGRLVSQYIVLIPIAYIGTITPFGVTAVFVAMIAETVSSALITGHRFRSGKWRIISRINRPSTSDI